MRRDSASSPSPTSPPVPIEAAELLREARLRASLTQVELAARAGVTQSVISTYENARREPSFSVLQRLILAAGFAPRVELEPTDPTVSLRSRVDDRRRELVAALAGLGGSNVRLFGSVARGDEGPTAMSTSWWTSTVASACSP